MLQINLLIMNVRTVLQNVKILRSLVATVGWVAVNLLTGMKCESRRWATNKECLNRNFNKFPTSYRMRRLIVLFLIVLSVANAMQIAEVLRDDGYAEKQLFDGYREFHKDHDSHSDTVLLGGYKTVYEDRDLFTLFAQTLLSFTQQDKDDVLISCSKGGKPDFFKFFSTESGIVGLKGSETISLEPRDDDCFESVRMGLQSLFNIPTLAYPSHSLIHYRSQSNTLSSRRTALSLSLLLALAVLVPWPTARMLTSSVRLKTTTPSSWKHQRNRTSSLWRTCSRPTWKQSTLSAWESSRPVISSLTFSRICSSPSDSSLVVWVVTRTFRSSDPSQPGGWRFLTLSSLSEVTYSTLNFISC